MKWLLLLFVVVIAIAGCVNQKQAVLTSTTIYSEQPTSLENSYNATAITTSTSVRISSTTSVVTSTTTTIPEAPKLYPEEMIWNDARVQFRSDNLSVERLKGAIYCAYPRENLNGVLLYSLNRDYDRICIIDKIFWNCTGKNCFYRTQEVHYEKNFTISKEPVDSLCSRVLGDSELYMGFCFIPEGCPCDPSSSAFLRYDPKYCTSDDDCIPSCGEKTRRGNCYNRYYLKENENTASTLDHECCVCEVCRPCTTCGCVNNTCTNEVVDINGCC
ncbi:MAG: hypothetical protein PHG85_06390 [Candidatus Altiarchaeota archaeon]|nr:hypothetical protein [Candidatus Altiarchaeota archaeon]